MPSDGDLRSAAPVAGGTRQGRLATSLGLVVGTDPNEAARLLAALSDLGPRGCRLEYLVLDDHGDPTRRELRTLVDTMGEASRVVRRPAGGLAAELDALTAASSSEFVVLCGADPEALAFVDPALSAMWVDGADAAVVGRRREAVEPDAAAAQLAATVADPASVLASALGLSGGPSAALVVIRRWVARWLLSELDRAIDAGAELTDRAHLLGFDLAELDEQGRRL